MSEPVVLEGRLRYAGSHDGYEVYLDNEMLSWVLCEAWPGTRRHETVVDPCNNPPSDGPEPWTPIPDPDEQGHRNVSACVNGEGVYVYMTTLGADWGRVRITIERLEEPTP